MIVTIKEEPDICTSENNEGYKSLYFAFLGKNQEKIEALTGCVFA